jgi:hypothetical protein
MLPLRAARTRLADTVPLLGQQRRQHGDKEPVRREIAIAQQQRRLEDLQPRAQVSRRRTLPHLLAWPGAQVLKRGMAVLACPFIAFSEVGAMTRENVGCSRVTEAPWGRLVAINLPGGSKLGVYEPKHARPPA